MALQVKETTSKFTSKSKPEITLSSSLKKPTICRVFKPSASRRFSDKFTDKFFSEIIIGRDKKIKLRTEFTFNPRVSKVDDAGKITDFRTYAYLDKSEKIDKNILSHLKRKEDFPYRRNVMPETETQSIGWYFHTQNLVPLDKNDHRLYFGLVKNSNEMVNVSVPDKVSSKLPRFMLINPR